MAETEVTEQTPYRVAASTGSTYAARAGDCAGSKVGR